MIPARSSQRTERTATTGGPVQAACDPHRTSGTVVGRLTAQHLVVPLPLDLDLWDIQIETGHLVAERFTLCRHEETGQIWLETLEVLNGLTRLSTPTEKALEVIHGMAIAGQQVRAL
jgi:hypothetical protein